MIKSKLLYNINSNYKLLIKKLVAIKYGF